MQSCTDCEWTTVNSGYPLNDYNKNWYISFYTVFFYINCFQNIEYYTQYNNIKKLEKNIWFCQAKTQNHAAQNFT